jgi:hypothetical protein
MNRVVIAARQATQAGRIGSLESILWLLKSLKIRAQSSSLDNEMEMLPFHLEYSRAGMRSTKVLIPFYYRDGILRSPGINSASLCTVA